MLKLVANIILLWSNSQILWSNMLQIYTQLPYNNYYGQFAWSKNAYGYANPWPNFHVWPMC